MTPAFPGYRPMAEGEIIEHGDCVKTGRNGIPVLIPSKCASLPVEYDDVGNYFRPLAKPADAPDAEQSPSSPVDLDAARKMLEAHERGTPLAIIGLLGEALDEIRRLRCPVQTPDISVLISRPSPARPTDAKEGGAE